MILRLAVQKDGLTRAWLYQNGQSVFEYEGDNMAQVATELDKKLQGQWSKVGGIYVFLGPAGYSRLRATHAFSLGISLAQQVPIAGYRKWNSRSSTTVPRRSRVVLKPVYPH